MPSDFSKKCRAVAKQAAISYGFFALIAFGLGASLWLWFVAIPIALALGIIYTVSSNSGE